MTQPIIFKKLTIMAFKLYLVTGGNMPDRLQVLTMPVVTNAHCGIA